ncbi:MAG: hypothetical protein ACREMI_04885 [Gemmatimonadales bacterium]
MPPDSLRRVVTEVFARPEYRWVEHQRVASWLSRQWLALLQWLDRLELQHPIGYNVALVLVIIALVALLVHIGYVIWRIVQPAARIGTAVSPLAGRRVLDAAAHRELAERLARAGRYAEALAHRFLAVVLDLDRRKALRFHLSKTPAEYVSEARLSDAGRATLAGLVAQLYRHLFGALPCGVDEYQTFDAAARALTEGPYVVPA